MSTSLVVIAGGDLGDEIARLGREHAAFDRRRRRVLRRGDSAYPNADTIEMWSRSGAAAIVFNESTVITLNEQRATNAAWLEDAFVRASTAHC